jgi:ATP-binding protein involved in chromosome partitioning
VEYHGVKIMSAQFLIAEDQPLDWAMPLVGLLLRRLVHDVAWGDLDLLLVDVPPGTGDLQQELFGLLPDAQVVLVVTPQYAAHLDGRKLVSMLRRRTIPIVGGVENMSGLDCPSCGDHIALFPRVAHEYAIWGQGIEELGRIPFCAVDAGPETPAPLVVAAPDSAAARELVGFSKKLISILG